MTNTNRFQPGDKVKAGAFVADLGLTPGRIYTVHHVDDFGLVQPETARHHYHPSHFELVMRAVADETYCLKDEDGDWWLFEAPRVEGLFGVWSLVEDATLYRVGFDAGAELVAERYGIDAEPTAPAETYCLKDKRDGDWHIADTAEGPFLLVGGAGETYRAYETIEARWGIDTASTSDTALAELRERLNGPADAGNSTGPSLHFEAVPLQPEPGDRARIVRTSATDASHGIADGMRGVGDEFTVTEVGTNSHGPYAKGDAGYWWHPEDLEKVTDSPAPLTAGDWVKVLARVDFVYENGSILAQTFQSDGSNNGGQVYAIASAITRTDEVPDWAVETKPARCGSAYQPTGHDFTLRLCEHEHGHDGTHLAGFSQWTDAEEYGRVEVTER